MKKRLKQTLAIAIMSVLVFTAMSFPTVFAAEVPAITFGTSDNGTLQQSATLTSTGKWDNSGSESVKVQLTLPICGDGLIVTII